MTLITMVIGKRRSREKDTVSESIAVRGQMFELPLQSESKLTHDTPGK